MDRLREFEIINDFFKPLANNCRQSQGLSDDVARISVKQDEELIVSKDIAMEDVHFFKSDGGFNIATKILLSNLSDIAASGGRPLYYMLGFSKNNNLDIKFFEDFARGLKFVQKQYNISLIGGDTIKSSDKLFFSITIFGSIKKNQILQRKNAKDGDLIFVSGSLGEAFIGLQILTKKIKIENKRQEKYFLERHFCPTPRIKLAQILVKNKISKCAIDVSDGLLADLKHICDESKVEAFIYQNKIPLPKINDNGNLFFDLISSGDDYEIIFTANKKYEEDIAKLAKKLKIKITKIGYIKKLSNSSELTVLDEFGKKINCTKYGYQH